MSADLLIKSNAIFDSIAEKPYEGFVAIKGKKIMAVGNPKDAEEYVGENTKVYDVGDKLVMAGFHDSHVHFLMSGLFKTYVNLFNAKTEEEAAAMVKKAYDASPNKEGWVFGFGWYHYFWDSGIAPTKKSLDKYFPDTPVFLINAEAHGSWVNSKALEIAGITKDTPNPFGGEIVRDENGEATGFLYETATGLVGKHAMVFEPEQEKEIIRSFLNSTKEEGITSLNDVQPYFHGDIGSLEVYSEMDKSGELTARLHVAPDLLGDLDKVEEARDKYRSDRLRIEWVKQFLDGVANTHTALMLEGYADDPDFTGEPLSDLEAIEKAVSEAHRRGLSVELHACGDRSARLGLDFYEKAIKTHGKNKCRHSIEHCELVSEEDIPRFKELGVIPSVQPEHVALTDSFEENPYRVVLGEERAARTWPFKKLLDTTGVLAIGTDCPVVDSNPFAGIYRAVTRLHNDGQPEGGWNPTQKLSLYEVLRGYTYGSAYGVSREDELGTLEAGKFADVIVINQNLFDIDPSKIRDSKVDLTILDGEIIFERDENHE